VSSSLSYDAVVIGAGVAGLTAAARLAEGGARVCVLAKGVGSTHLAPGTIDVLGRLPELVTEPARALPEFVASRPQHPYALVGADAVGPALEWFRGVIERGPQPGYRYLGGLERNHLLPTALGAARPSAMVPESMAAGELTRSGSVCVVGLRALRDFHPTLCAANMSRNGTEARGVELDLDVGWPDANALLLGRRMDDPAFREAFAARLAPLLGSEERVALPAILGLRDPHAAWSDLSMRLERELFEVPTLPPSASGMRVYDALRAALRTAGGRLVIGAEVTGAAREGERVSALRARTSGHETEYLARWVVLASGGLNSGAIELGSDWRAREQVLGLPLRGMPEPGEPRFVSDYFAEQPMARVGVAVAPSLIAAGTENVFVAGAALPGAEPWREGSGEGIALASGSAVARAIMDRERVGAAA
jgi:glycerol-3-phosphate dehydrogenase subunit B